MTKVLFLIVCTLLPIPLFAATPVHDPNQSLINLRKYLGVTPFTAAFTCNDSAAIHAFVISCKDYSATTSWHSATCEQVNDPKGTLVHRQVTNCTDDQVSLMVDVTGDMTSVTAADFAAVQGNTLELFLSQLVDFTGYDGAELTINSILPTTYVFARDSANPRTVDAMTLTGTFGQPELQPFNVIITVTKNALGVAQIVRFRLDNQTWFLVDDFTGGQP